MLDQPPIIQAHWSISVQYFSTSYCFLHLSAVLVLGVKLSYHGSISSYCVTSHFQNFNLHTAQSHAQPHVQLVEDMASDGGRYTTEHYPSASDAGRSITQNGFRITTRKLPILKAKPIGDMTEALGIAPPEMIFGDNSVTIEHSDSGFGINFNTFDALDRVDKTGNSMLQVAHSREWQSTRYEELGNTD